MRPTLGALLAVGSGVLALHADAGLHVLAAVALYTAGVALCTSWQAAPR